MWWFWGILAAVGALFWFRAKRAYDGMAARLRDTRAKNAALEDRIADLERANVGLGAAADAQERVTAQKESALTDAEARIAELRGEAERVRVYYEAQMDDIRADERAAQFEKLLPLLVQLPSLERAISEGVEIGAADVLKLLAPLDQMVKDMGYVKIGEPGEEVAFDPRLHSARGDAPPPGRIARVRTVGFRREDEVIRRAQVVWEES